MTDSTKKHQIKIETQKKLPTRGVFADEKDSLLENLLYAEVEIDHSCGGNGTCGTCCIQVIEGLDSISAPSEIELEMIQDRNFGPTERLSCQSYVRGTIRIKIS